MELQQRIEQALKDAMRGKDEVGRDAIRMLLTAMKNKEKELKRPPNEPEIQQIISSLIKQRKDASEQYLRGRREDLAAKEQEEIRILQQFLPEPLGPEELESLIDEAIREVGAVSIQDLGKVMKAAIPKVAGRVDGKQVNEVVRKKLQS